MDKGYHDRVNTFPAVIAVSILSPRGLALATNIRRSAVHLLCARMRTHARARARALG